MRTRHSYVYILTHARTHPREASSINCRIRVVERRGGRRTVGVYEVGGCRRCAEQLRNELERGRMDAAQAAEVAEDFAREHVCSCGYGAAIEVQRTCAF